MTEPKDVNLLVAQIWANVCRVESNQDKYFLLTQDEWQLILDEWPEIYGSYGYIKLRPEEANAIRDDWKKRKVLAIHGREIKVKISDTKPVYNRDGITVKEMIDFLSQFSDYERVKLYDGNYDIVNITRMDAIGENLDTPCVNMSGTKDGSQ